MLFALIVLSPEKGLSQKKQPVRAKHGMVASAERVATHVGVEMLRSGGNAVDAAVATAFALAVTYPTAGNLGGGGFMLVRLANGNSVAIDYREIAPLAASRNMYLDAQGVLIPNASLVGRRAAGVPGTVAGMALALKKYGTKSWRDVIEPARRLAEDGFVVSEPLSESLMLTTVLADDPESKHIWQNDGKYFRAGDRIRQPDLARTLKRLQDNGPEEFYTGETARMFVQDMQRAGGIITDEDLRSYHAVEREPVKGTYRGYDITTMPPPSSGGIALIEMLNMMEKLPKEESGSVAHYHELIEVMRRAFADRSEYAGDPAFVKVPAAELMSKAYASKLARTISNQNATPSSEVKPGKNLPKESMHTTHFSVVDKWGNAVSNTFTLNTGYGTGITVKGLGFLLNNEMDDFASKPGEPNGYGLIQGESNAIQAGKRPLSSMTPTIITKNGKLVLVLGSPGGPTIINSVLEVAHNVVDHKMSINEAVDAPRVHHQWLPDTVTIEKGRLKTTTIARLTAMGHQFKRVERIGDVEAVMVEPRTGYLLGSSDPRSKEAATEGY